MAPPRLHLLPLLLSAACAGGERPPAAAPADVPAASAAASAGAAAFEDEVRPELPPGDPAVATLERYLALSLVDAADDPDGIAALLGCSMPAGPELPAELLAAYEISGRGRRGDTTIVRARVVTVAEQDRGRADPSRLAARQRVRHGEWEWDLVEQDGAWRVCTGPRFGFVGDPSETIWRTEGASLETARELAATVRAERRP